MIQIDDPPTVSACASCPAPLVWLWSARRKGWVAFVPVDDVTLKVHGCKPLQEPSTWRQVRRGTPPNPDYLAAKEQLQERGEETT